MAAPELESLRTKLKEISARCTALDLEKAGIKSFERRMDSSLEIYDRLSADCYDELCGFAKLHSGDWKQIQELLIKNGEDLFIVNPELTVFCEHVKNGLIPLWSTYTSPPPDRQLFYDFLDDSFVCLNREDDQVVRRRMIFLDLHDFRKCIIDRSLTLANLIPINFITRLSQDEEDRHITY